LILVADFMLQTKLPSSSMKLSVYALCILKFKDLFLFDVMLMLHSTSTSRRTACAFEKFYVVCLFISRCFNFRSLLSYSACTVLVLRTSRYLYIVVQKVNHYRKYQ